jgi:hypothetical protein
VLVLEHESAGTNQTGVEPAPDSQGGAAAITYPDRVNLTCTFLHLACTFLQSILRLRMYSYFTILMIRPSSPHNHTPSSIDNLFRVYEPAIALYHRFGITETDSGIEKVRLKIAKASSSDA